MCAWSPYKNTIIAYVAAHPGCSKWDVASLCTYNSRRCPSKQYYIVNTALRHDWIVGYRQGRAYRLYTPDHPEWVAYEEQEALRAERKARRQIKPQPSLAQRLAAFKLDRANQRRVAEQRAKERADYEAACAMPPGRIRFTAEGGFRADNN
jgi:hypothetical protein